MDRRNFIGIGLTVASGLVGMPTASAQVTNMNDAINKSGRQRMLSQRLAKAYLQLGQDIDANRSKRILDSSIALFDRQLVELKAFAPTQDNKTVLLKLTTAWQTYKETLVGRSPNQQDAKSILGINEDVQAMANAATVQLEKLSGTATGRLVNLSGRQRMLSQRMAKFYQALNWDIAPPGAQKSLLEARKEFIAAQTELTNAAQNIIEIKRELELAQQQWLFFDNALQAVATSTDRKLQFATNVATTSERILETMDRVTTMYEKLA